MKEAEAGKAKQDAVWTDRRIDFLGTVRTSSTTQGWKPRLIKQLADKSANYRTTSGDFFTVTVDLSPVFPSDNLGTGRMFAHSESSDRVIG